MFNARYLSYLHEVILLSALSATQGDLNSAINRLKAGP